MSTQASPPPELHLPARFDAATREALRARLESLPRRRLLVEEPRAAVLVPLCHAGGEPSVLFTKRSETVGTHKGQVSFPGGRRDPTDVDDVHTALRELHEEVGIPSAAVEVLGLFHEAMAITGIGVTPIVGFVGDVDAGQLAISRAEIDEAFTVPLRLLVSPAHRGLQTFGPRTLPVFSAGPHPIWGLTAWILDELLREGLGLPLPPLLPVATTQP